MNNKVYLITGANIGLGLDAVRQLALKNETRIVYLACRTKSKALDAMDSLIKKQNIAAEKLAFVPFDASADKAAIGKAMIDHLPKDVKLDGIILNAGGMGHDKTGLPSGPNHVMDVVQINLIGHIHLLGALADNGFLHSNKNNDNDDNKTTTIVFSGSETARGIPSLGFPTPEIPNTAPAYQDFIEGKSYEQNNQKQKTKNYDGMATYPVVKGIGALYFTAWARKHPECFVLTVSPGLTSGTNFGSQKSLPKIFRLFQPIATKFLACIRVGHGVRTGAKRYVDAVTRQAPYQSFESGTFVASVKGAAGPVDDQTKFSYGVMYADRGKQEAAYQALQVYS